MDADLARALLTAALSKPPKYRYQIFEPDGPDTETSGTSVVMDSEEDFMDELGIWLRDSPDYTEVRVQRWKLNATEG